MPLATKGRVRRPDSCERAKNVIRCGNLPESRRATDSRLAGKRHLVIRKKNERAFRTAVKKLGYILPQ